MSFSATCPTFTEEQLREEFESFTPEEKELLRRDLYGHISLHDENKEIKDNSKLEDPAATQQEDAAQMEIAIQMFHEALESIPAHEKACFEKAKLAAPRVVEQESHPSLFLRTERFDAWAAAKRMVEYWRIRAQVFGGKFYSPMTLSPGGAMAEEKYIEVLKQGSILVLPKDELGRVAFQWDRILQKQVCGSDRNLVLRIWFYIVHHLSMTQEGARNGTMAMFNMKGYDMFQHYDRALVKNAIRIFNVMPMRMQAIHVFTGSGGKSKGLVATLLLPIMLYMFPRDWRHRIIFHAGSELEVLEELKRHHSILPQHLGTRLGGTFTNDMFWNMIQEQDALIPQQFYGTSSNCRLLLSPAA